MSLNRALNLHGLKSSNARIPNSSVAEFLAYWPLVVQVFEVGHSSSRFKAYLSTTFIIFFLCIVRVG